MAYLESMDWIEIEIEIEIGGLLESNGSVLLACLLLSTLLYLPTYQSSLSYLL